ARGGRARARLRGRRRAPRIGSQDPRSRIVGVMAVTASDTYDVRSPYDGSVVGTVRRATPEDVEQAIVAALASFEETRRLPSWRREQILMQISQGLAARRDELDETLVGEDGMTLKTGLLEGARTEYPE